MQQQFLLCLRFSYLPTQKLKGVFQANSFTDLVCPDIKPADSTPLVQSKRFLD
jgi:hypothetical protein